jgi:hypothetical protein
MRLHTSANKDEIRQTYMPALAPRLTVPLAVKQSVRMNFFGICFMVALTIFDVRMELMKLLSLWIPITSPRRTGIPFWISASTIVTAKC